MTKRFEAWGEYQSIPGSHREFVGCSVYNNISRPPYIDLIDEFYMEAGLHQSDSLEVGKGLAELVLGKFQFEKYDHIDTIMEPLNSEIKIMDASMKPAIYSICRIPLEPRAYETRTWCIGGSSILKGFTERMKRNTVD